jgi:hypothetical protein
MASPLQFGLDDWNTWFAPQGNTVDGQIFAEVEPMSFGTDIPDSSDLNSYTVDYDGSLLSSSHTSLSPGLGDPPMTWAFPGSVDGIKSTAEDGILQPDGEEVTDWGTYAAQDDQIDTENSLDSFTLAAADWAPTPSNPCPNIETLCCENIQYAPLLYVEPCTTCMT